MGCNRRNSRIKTDSADASLPVCGHSWSLTFPACDLCCGEIERNERVTIYSGVTRLCVTRVSAGDATRGLFLTSDQGPHPALPHNMIIITDKFYREYREYSDHDEESDSERRLLFTSPLRIIPSFTLYSYGPGPPVYHWQLCYVIMCGVTTHSYQSVVSQHQALLSLLSGLRTSAQSEWCQQADVKLPGFPSGHPLRVREASQCSSYFNNSPTPGVHCPYPQILGFIQPVSVLCNSALGWTYLQ